MQREASGKAAARSAERGRRVRQGHSKAQRGKAESRTGCDMNCRDSTISSGTGFGGLSVTRIGRPADATRGPERETEPVILDDSRSQWSTSHATAGRATPKHTAETPQNTDIALQARTQLHQSGRLRLARTLLHLDVLQVVDPVGHGHRAVRVEAGLALVLLALGAVPEWQEEEAE